MSARWKDSHPAEWNMAVAAARTGHPHDLYPVLQALGLVPGIRTIRVPQWGATPASWRRGDPRLMHPLTVPRERGTCPLGGCTNDAPEPGVPCSECMAALQGYVRFVPAGGAA